MAALFEPVVSKVKALLDNQIRVTERTTATKIKVRWSFSSGQTTVGMYINMQWHVDYHPGRWAWRVEASLYRATQLVSC
jgi:hypothetical protein